MSNYAEGRLPPFAWISRAAADALLDEFDGRERAMALSVYVALALLSSQQLRGDHDGVVATRAEVATVAGVSDRTVDTYTERMAAIGLLRKTRRRNGRLNDPNIWTMIEPSVGANVLHPHGGEARSPDTGEPGSPPSGEPRSPLKKKNDKKKESVAASPPADELAPEIERLCSLMSEHVRASHGIASSSKEARVNEGWRAACRALLALDVNPPETTRAGQHYTAAQIEYAIAWVCRHHYWRRRIKSMTRLRSEMPQVAKELHEAAAANARRVAPPAQDARGMSASARARFERTQRRMAVVQAAQDQPHPQGAPDEHDDDDGHVGGPRDGTSRAPELALASGSAA